LLTFHEGINVRAQVLCTVSNSVVLAEFVHCIMFHHTLSHCFKIVLFCRAVIERVQILESASYQLT